MWISNGEKYALVGLEVKLDGQNPPEQVAPALWVLTNATFDVSPEWREWLGSIRANQIATSNLFLVSKVPSATPHVLDDENQSLERSVWCFYVGLLLSAMFSPKHKPVMLTGARRDGVIDIREQKNLALPIAQAFRPHRSLVADDILRAAQLGQKLDAMHSNTVPDGLGRLFQILKIYVETRAIVNLTDRIHQFCRCIEGLILPASGKTKQQFKSRTELFLGPKHHDLMGSLYEIRSDDEHLHENRYLETFNREVRLDLLKKEAIAEYVARTALARIVSQDSLWQHFGNTSALEGFWDLSPTERRKAWGDPVDPLAAIADFDPNHLHDRHLRKL